MEQGTAFYDLSFLKKFTKDNPDKVEQYIRTYLRTSERIFSELEEAGKQDNWDDLYIKAHSVKPQVQYMGIASLQEVLLEIEHITKLNPEPDKLRILVSDAMQLYKRSSDGLRMYLSEMSK